MTLASQPISPPTMSVTIRSIGSSKGRTAESAGAARQLR
jgi:hypothetical protein